MKRNKIFLIIIFAMTVGAFLVLVNINSRLEKIAYERDSVSDDWLHYSSKKDECSGRANTTNYYINNAGLTDCGADLAIEAKTKFVSLSDIYHNYCNMGFGMAVYGCTIPLTRQVYVCIPGTTLYDERVSYASYYYTEYEYISYACEDVGNTIRHELLHLVYLDLTDSERSAVDSKLAKYESRYASQINSYSSTQRASELFVRVGADGTKVDDIQLADLYSKVSASYTEQKQEYYGTLENTAEEYLDKYNDLYDSYSVFRVLAIIFLIVNILTLAALAFSSKEPFRDICKNLINRNKPKITIKTNGGHGERDHECGVCGALAHSGDVYCSECGAWLGSSSRRKEVNVFSKNGKRTEKKKREDIVPAFIIVALLLLLIICFVVSSA